MQTLIVIPARYASTRLPGKPLLMINGQTMLERVVRLSQVAAQAFTDVSVIVATDDDRIMAHCKNIGVQAMMTSPELQSGTDRVAAVVREMQRKPDFILNMQGDAPFTPPSFLKAMITAFRQSPSDAVITPVAQLTWAQLDQLRQCKLTTPFSGTTVTFDANTGNAFWFSKQIIPAIRNEAALRKIDKNSPVFQHIGLYGYSRKMLEKYVQLPAGKFEKLEGLEQLRLLENNYTIKCIPVDSQDISHISGIDSPVDIERVTALL